MNFSAFLFGNDLAAVNIQRGRDHGIPSYTQWREPCGLTPIRDWKDFEKIVGPSSTRRIQQGYSHVDDVDLFVGGLAERPVVGGLVGPVFACVIAQQFSNLRKGDRFWYENNGFESSFTPAQLQSIRQVLLSQVVCRTLGDGTLQPHVFLPHDIESNERVVCGTGSLTPIDLKPWLERDPFIKQFQKPETSKVQNDTESDRKDSESVSKPIPTKPNNDIVDSPISSSLSNGNRPINLNQKVQEPFVVNGVIINNKLDLSVNKRPIKSNNKTGHRVKVQKTPNVRTTTKRTVTRGKKPTRRPTNENNQNGQTNNKRRKNKRRNHVQKRDLTNTEKSRGAILLDFDRTSSYSPFNKGHETDDKKQVVILTPDENDFEIEINIRPNNNKNKKQTTSKPTLVVNNKFGSLNRQQFYNVQQLPQPSNPYGINDEPTKRPIQQDNVTQRPSYYGIITKRPSYNNNRYSVHEDYDTKVTTTTKRPYYHIHHDSTIKYPSYSNYNVNDGIDITTKGPYYNRPATQSDHGGYGSNNHDSLPASSGYRPIYDTATQYGTLDDDTYKPYYTARPSSIRPSNDDTNYQYRPTPLHVQNGQTSYGGQTQHDIVTSRPKPITSFSYNSQNDHTERPPIIYLHDDWDKTTTKPPQILTFYSVMTTTRNKRRTRPTQPVNPYQPILNDDNDNEDDDDEGISNYFDPSWAISNIVNTFSDYFTTSTTTRRPYIEHDQFDDWDSNPYAQYTQYAQSPNFAYSRQKDVHEIDDHYKTATENYQLTLRKNEMTTTKTNTYNDANGNVTEQDPYWYLRPDYTKYDRQKNMTFDDDRTFRTRQKFISNVKIETIDKTSRLRHTDDVNVATVRDIHDRGLIKCNDSRTFRKLMFDENSTTNLNVEREPKAKQKQPILVVPLKVLTKPER